jgi:phytoene dehydrogenase-like protein
MINVPADNDYDWDNLLVSAREKVISKISTLLKVNIGEYITFEEHLTPDAIERTTGSSKGSLYGISSNNKMAAFLRQQNRSRQYKGLYFCGGSAHPGGGIPLVVLSAKITADLINKYELNHD